MFKIKKKIMNTSSFNLNVYDQKTPVKVDIFATDTNEIIKYKIIHAIEPNFPSFVFFPKTFDIKRFLEKANTFTFLNLLTVKSIFNLKPYDKKIDIHYKLLEELSVEFSIDNDTLYQLFIISFVFVKIFYITLCGNDCEKEKATITKCGEANKKKDRMCHYPLNLLRGKQGKNLVCRDLHQLIQDLQNYLL